MATSKHDQGEVQMIYQDVRAYEFGGTGYVEGGWGPKDGDCCIMFGTGCPPGPLPCGVGPEYGVPGGGMPGIAAIITGLVAYIGW